jgi:hydrogenase nickel incorporation protein HypB
MCTTCGCAAGETRIEGEAVHAHDHDHAHEHWHVHEDGTAHSHAHHDHGAGHAHAHDEHEHAHTHADGTTHAHPHHHHGEHHHDHGGVTAVPSAAAHAHAHTPADGTTHVHPHVHEGEHHHTHETDGSVHYGKGAAGAHAPGMSQSRMVQIERDILSKNDAYAAKNRAHLDERGIFALNLVSSPGSGKTTLLCRTIEALKSKLSLYVVEGDQQTSHVSAPPARRHCRSTPARAATSMRTWSVMPSRSWRRPTARCFSSRTSATSSARRPSISVRRTRWRSSR